MTPLRFRAKAVDPSYGLIAFGLGSIGNWIDVDGVFYADGIPCLIDSIQQSTGVNDQHGEEIFEGDVVKSRMEFIKDAEVVWSSGRAGFFVKGADATTDKPRYGFFWVTDEKCDYEIIPSAEK